jgi:acyl carrier protein
LAARAQGNEVLRCDERAKEDEDVYKRTSLVLPGECTLKGETLTMNVRTEIVTQFKQVAQEQNKRLAPLTDGLELLNSGLDSLCFAILVTRLEDSLGVDPFTASEDTGFPVTFGDFVNLYEHVAK